MRRSHRPISRRLIPLALALGCAHAVACATAVTVNISQKTSLERQLIGEFEPYSEEELLAISVRAQRDIGRGTLDDLQQRAIAARRRQQFNRDDIDELLSRGCLGEGTGARLVTRPCDATSDVEVKDRLERLVREENEDRTAIIDWALATDPVLTPDDRNQVVAVYGRLVRERLGSGHWYETDKGWKRR